jgi:hypothetical protein
MISPRPGLVRTYRDLAVLLVCLFGLTLALASVGFVVVRGIR